MPLKLVPPRGTRKNYAIRGTINGVRIEKSTGTTRRDEAERALKKAQREEREQKFALPTDPTFGDAADRYLADGGETRFIEPLIIEIGDKPLKLIDQRVVDDLAVKLYPTATPATRNRQVYSPVIAILRHEGINPLIRRPKGAQGQARTGWLWPEQVQALVEASRKVHIELPILIVFLVSTGARLSEVLNMRCQDIRLEDNFAFCGKTKNGDPRAMHLPPAVVEALRAHPRGLARDGRVFNFTKAGKLYKLVSAAYSEAGLPDGDAPFHILRHTFATWMRRYADADDKTLLDTGAWRSPASVDRYRHTVVSESAKLADKLPLPGFGSEKNTQKTPTQTT